MTQKKLYRVISSSDGIIVDHIFASNLMDARRKAGINAKVKNYKTSYIIERLKKK